MLRRTVQPARTLIGMVARRQMSSMEGVFGAAAKALDTEVPGLTPAQLAGRYNGKLEALNEWILGEERDYLASKGESKSLDDVTGAAPLKLYGVAGRYATGLYNSAVKAKELGKVDTDIKKLVSAANSSASVMNFIASPTVGRADRLKGIEGVSQALGLCTTTKNFLGVLAASSRTKFLMAIADNLSQLTAAASGEQTVTLTAPRVLPDMVEKSIIDDIKKEFMPWQKVRIVRQYDPDVIQGYIVDFGDKILDKSYGSKLRKMKNALSGLDA